MEVEVCAGFKLRAEGGKGVRVKKSGDLGRASPGPHPGPISTRYVTIGKTSDILGLCIIHLSNKGLGLDNSYEAFGSKVL